MDQIVGQHEIDVGVDVSIRPKVLVVAAGVALANSSRRWHGSLPPLCLCSHDGGDTITLITNMYWLTMVDKKWFISVDYLICLI